ncbi:hypothetical protein U9M48_016418 [Paspalum notatum var. saurae]|uniref:Sulfotransferase n=1 Tax=Paspalum notatum var. saurae TaxID=547442 RepID=A0AAQ3T965_PASNO
MAAQPKEEGSPTTDTISASSYDEAAISSDESQDDDTAIAALVSKLPTREGWSQTLVLYKNYWIHPLFLKSILRLHTSFKPRHDDITLASNPKCGTTWMKALAFTITNRSRYEFDNNHPLLTRHPQELVPSMEIPRDTNDDLKYLEALPSPRLLATHMPLSLFSRYWLVVYVCREPKDAFVSWWHYANKIGGKEHSTTDGLESALDMFIQGFSPYGPFWEHCLEYWRQSITSPDNNVLFLKYEDMMSEPVKHIIRLAAFLGVPFSTKEEEDGVPDEVVRLCSFEKLSGLRANHTGGTIRSHSMVLDKSAFFRKGMVGDWVNHMTEVMGRKIDCVMEEKLRGSGLVL